MSKDEKVLDDAPFEIPPFEEQEYIRKELISFKTTLILFGFSIVVAGLSFVLWKFNPTLRFSFQVLIALGLGVLLVKWIFRAFRVDLSHWKRKEWVGTFLLYFFFWLGFFLLFSNPPITDAAHPAVEVAVSPAAQAVGQPIQFGAYIADNRGLQTDSLVFCIHHVAANQTIPPGYSQLSVDEQRACARPWARQEAAPFWTHRLVPETPGLYAWFVIATDAQGQVTERAGVLEVGDPFSLVEPPRNSEFVVRDDSLNVCLDSELRLYVVQYSTDGGQTYYNFTQDSDPTNPGCWKTNPRYPGWVAGSNRLTLRAVEQPHFLRNGLEVSCAQERLDLREPRGCTLVDPHGPYNLTVAESYAEVGRLESPTFQEDHYVHPAQTPALGLFPVLLSLAGFTLWRRR